MSLEDFVSKRKKEIEGKMAQSEINVLFMELHEKAIFTDCRACLFFENGFCSEQNTKLPEQIIAIGCDKGSKDIPF